jgi:hypothetical protein
VVNEAHANELKDICENYDTHTVLAMVLINSSAFNVCAKNLC